MGEILKEAEINCPHLTLHCFKFEDSYNFQNFGLNFLKSFASNPQRYGPKNKGHKISV